MQGNDKGEECGMGVGESEARCRARAADESGVATGLMVFLLMQR